MIKFRVNGQRYIFWIARTDAELPTKDNSWKLPEHLALILIKELKR
jgi:hypothetical protein